MLDGHPDIRAVALDYYGTLVDVGKPFDRIRAWFAEKLHGSGVDPQTFFHRFSRERARLYTAEFRLGYELLVESYEAACRRFHTGILCQTAKASTQCFLLPDNTNVPLEHNS